ncbi:MAG TPA: TlpA disulfide reductase family protein [Pyrinomonadaceae bacterium]|jgi:thiol-disulfide isomerase/thioredoxin
MSRGTHLLLCAALALSAAGVARAQTAEQAAPVSVKLKGVDGKTYDVAGMRGAVVLVSFGATWCKPCEWELTALEELKEEYARKPVRFLWVSVDTKQQASDDLVRYYAKRHNLTMPVLRDPDYVTFGQFSDRLRLPMVVFFDRTGAFAAPKHTGMSADPIEYKRRMRARLDALLAAPRSAQGGAQP